MKYRIIRKSMFDYCGRVEYKGSTCVYLIQYKTWLGYWKTMDSTLCLTEEDIFKYLKMAQSGRLTKKGDQIYEDS